MQLKFIILQSATYTAITEPRNAIAIRNAVSDQYNAETDIPIIYIEPGQFPFKITGRAPGQMAFHFDRHIGEPASSYDFIPRNTGAVHAADLSGNKKSFTSERNSRSRSGPGYDFWSKVKDKFL